MHIGKSKNILAVCLIALCAAFSSCRSDTDITDGTAAPELTESGGVSQTENGITVTTVCDTTSETTETTSLSMTDTETSDSESDLTETGETSGEITETVSDVPTETVQTEPTAPPARTE